MRMPLPLFDYILRLFRRPAPAPVVTTTTYVGVPPPNLRALGAPPSADLQLLLANGRAAAKQMHGMQDDPAAPKPKPVPTKFTAQCGWCLEPFDREPRTPHQLEPLRQMLYIQGPQALVHIDICDTCYESVVGSAAKLNNNSSLDIGQSNSGPPNLLLQQAMR